MSVENMELRSSFIGFCAAVVHELRGTSPPLEAEFDAAREIAFNVAD
jgi:hypothetical protein